MRTPSIHAYLLKKLLAVFVALSAVVCVFDYFYELEKVDEHVLTAAMAESSHFMADEMHLIRNNDVEVLKNNAQGHLHYSKFIILEFYDASKKRIVEVSSPGSDIIEKEFNKREHAQLLSDTAQYEKLDHQGHLFLRVASPLFAEGQIAGYFEGIYAVDDGVLGEIKAQMAVSLLKVVAVAFLTTLVLYPVILSLNRKVLDYAGVLLDANIGTLESLGNAVAKRDSDTNAHNYRVTLYAIALGRSLGMGTSVLQELVKGAFLHDVGKIAISDGILLKPGKLTEEEFAIMKTHVGHGVEILKDYQWMRDAVNVVAFHHEKYDGSGYATGLKGEAIPATARVFAVVDVFDALTSKRPYKEPFSLEKSLEILHQGAGAHFDPVIVEAFAALAQPLHDTLNTADDAALKQALRGHIREIFG